ncbi:MAG: LysR family transcriptional regulator, partial [Candidatus Sulfotelmatobacter sp.]
MARQTPEFPQADRNYTGAKSAIIFYLLMDFDQLITFLEVARQRSFSRAGEKVFRSQSAVSAQIRQLEQEYGDRLLDRSGKTVKLTPAGQIFYEYALRLKSLRDESLVAVADHG